LYQDAHLHIAADTKLDISSEIGRVFINSTSPEDYRTIGQASCENVKTLAFFGLHPWMTSSRYFSSAQLSAALEACPAAGIGEAGLDLSSKYKAEIDTQAHLFMQQLELAVKLKRTLSIHCVKAWQRLFESLDKIGPLPKPFILHSFYGSIEVLKRLLSYGAYISISSLSVRNPEHSRPVIAGIPLNRLLIESDMAAGSTGFTPENHLQELKKLYNIASSITGLSVNEIGKRVWDNGTVFTN